MKVWVAEAWDPHEESTLLGAFHSPYIAMCECAERDGSIIVDWQLIKRGERNVWQGQGVYEGFDIHEMNVEPE